MSVPEELVQAAAEAIPTRLSTGYQLLAQEKVEVARLALAAAFAALPECEEVQSIYGYRLGWVDCLAALAREFGEPT